MNNKNECRYCLHALKNKPVHCPRCGSLLVQLTRGAIGEGQITLGLVVLFMAVVIFSEVTGLSLLMFGCGGVLVTGLVDLGG